LCPYRFLIGMQMPISKSEYGLSHLLVAARLPTWNHAIHPNIKIILDNDEEYRHNDEQLRHI
jgi:hypothetical protein